MSLLMTYQKWGTYVIDLGLPLTTLFRNIKKEARKNIKKVEMNPGIVVRVNEHDMYYNYLSRERKKKGLRTSSIDRFYSHTIKQVGYCNFVAVLDEMYVLGGIGLVQTGEWTVKEQAKFRTDEDTFNIQDFLKWYIIKWAKEKGFKFFDLAGVHPHPTPGSKEWDIRRYKEKFGGVYREITIPRNRIGLLLEKLGLRK